MGGWSQGEGGGLSESVSTETPPNVEEKEGVVEERIVEEDVGEDGVKGRTTDNSRMGLTAALTTLESGPGKGILLASPPPFVR